MAHAGVSSSRLRSGRDSECRVGGAGSSSSSSELILPPDLWFLDPGIGQTSYSTIIGSAAAAFEDLFICLDPGSSNDVILEARRDHIYEYRSDNMW